MFVKYGASYVSNEYSFFPKNLYLFSQWEREAESNDNIPLDLFPKIFNSYGKELSRILQSENNFVIGGMIAALSGAIGNSVKLYSANYQNVPCFYIACIGNSGANKSETIRRLMQPLTTIESRLNETFDIQEYNYKKNKNEEKPIKFNPVVYFLSFDCPGKSSYQR